MRPRRRPTGLRKHGGLALLTALLLPITAAAEPSTSAPSSEKLQRFEEERLLLLDHRGAAIGPESADFPAEDFGLLNEQRFHVVHAGDLRYRLSFEEFMRSADDHRFQQRWDDAQSKIRRQRRASVGMMVAGGVLSAGGLVLASLAYANGEGDIMFALPLIFGSGAGFFVGGGAFATSAKRKAADLASQNLEVLADRDEAWEASASYNDALWSALSLSSSEPSGTEPDQQPAP